ncbi:hypothetical protein MLD38_012382 [Melastoma candidum]|uniref:Uncharacterized protein n=1 Tax=Melastoma candidum TaxID=119954 RepID=A0ACB9R774_9MYRT|nr:hypothetical protein MLD38_012382 [Melastoma candidum]
MSTADGDHALVVEVVSAHNLMPKDGEGSSSPFVEVRFDNQRLRTRVKPKDLNPVWNETLIFSPVDLANLPYMTLDVHVFNERRSVSSRSFLGKVRVPGSDVAKARADEVGVQVFALDKRNLFSHVRGEISLKLCVRGAGEVKGIVGGAGGRGGRKGKPGRQQQPQPNAVLAVPRPQVVTVRQNMQNHLPQGGKPGGQGLVSRKPCVPGEMVPVVVAQAAFGGGVGGGGGGEYALKETRPPLGGVLSKDKMSATYDLVEQMQYLYVKVVKAREVTVLNGCGEVVAEVKLGNYRGIAKMVRNLEWDQVFAFSRDCVQSSMVEVFLKEAGKDEFLGRVWFDLNEVPKRVPPDSPLAPQWHRMEDRKGEKAKAGEVMLAVWFGTQADEAFSEAWHSKAANVTFDSLCWIKSKVYLSPKLWYLRVTVIEAQDVVPADRGTVAARFPELSVKAQVGNQVLRTRIASDIPMRSLSHPYWNEDMMFVVPEPFEDYLIVSVEDRVASNRDEVVGRVLIPVNTVERRMDDKPVVPRWFILDSHFGATNDSKVTTRFGSRMHLQVSLDGGYHVLDEAALYCSDVRPTAKQLWKPHVGLLEMGILGATGLVPVKIKEGTGGSTDAYCVAKYGQKWVRTRTVVDSPSPKWNEQYTWEVFDPCTVITVGVFDNSRVGKNLANNIAAALKDARIGKVRIRLSTLESDRVYTHSYPLLMLHPTGVKKMGELHLAVRFSCANTSNMLHMYTMPLLPKMHYVRPLSIHQLENLRYQAMNVVASRLSRAEPPLGREVVDYMLDHDSHMWSMRRSKANFFRLMNLLSGLVTIARCIELICSWHKPIYSAMFGVTFLWLVYCPELILPIVLLLMALTGLLRYRSRPRHPPHMDTLLSHAETVYPDELDEEFDSFPTTRGAELVKTRYDHLRSVAGRIQTVVSDMATQGERFQALLSWRDPRATFLFIIFCLITSVCLYAIPAKSIVAIWGVNAMRPPRFRSRLPCQALCFFRRLPTKADSLQ